MLVRTSLPRPFSVMKRAKSSTLRRTDGSGAEAGSTSARVALLLAVAGTLLGLGVAYGGVWVFNAQVSAFQLVVPLWAPLAAAAVSLATGIGFGLLPALRAARLDPVLALAGG